MHAVLPILFLVACTPEVTTTLIGQALDGPESEEGLANAEITVLDREGVATNNGTASEDGSFEIDAPGGINVYLEVTRDGYEVSSFTGVTGLSEVQYVEEGTVYGVSNALRDEWETLFAGCPDLGTGGLVFGEIRLYGYIDEVTGEEAPITTGWVMVETIEGETYEGCYLDNDGVFDSAAELTGQTGRFLLPGVPSGIHTLHVGYEITEGQGVRHQYPLRMPEGGVAPRFPAWVLLPAEP